MTEQMDADEVPFEAPSRPAPPPARASRRRGAREKGTSTVLTGTLLLLYALGTAGIGTINQGLLLLAWLLTGPLVLTAYVTFKKHKTL